MLKLGPKLEINLNTHDLMLSTMHGLSHKDQIVLHETVSGDETGLADILGVEKYLHQVGYGIHGMTDAEGFNAWALGLGNGVFWQTAGGNANYRSCGIEQVSNIPSAVEAANFSKLSLKNAAAQWAKRQKQLDATAKLCAAIHRTHPSIPLVLSRGGTPGITTHYLVTHFYGLVGGHWDCWPTSQGGYYPLEDVINEAKAYAKKGY